MMLMVCRGRTCKIAVLERLLTRRMIAASAADCVLLHDYHLASARVWRMGKLKRASRMGVLTDRRTLPKPSLSMQRGP